MVAVSINDTVQWWDVQLISARQTGNCASQKSRSPLRLFFSPTSFPRSPLHEYTLNASRPSQLYFRQCYLVTGIYPITPRRCLYCWLHVVWDVSDHDLFHPCGGWRSLGGSGMMSSYDFILWTVGNSSLGR